MAALVGRLLIAALFVVSGIWKITHFSTTAAYMVRIGMPVGEAAAVLAIVIELGGGILLAIGLRLRSGGRVLAPLGLVAPRAAHRLLGVESARLFREMHHILQKPDLIL